MERFAETFFRPAAERSQDARPAGLARVEIAAAGRRRRDLLVDGPDDVLQGDLSGGLRQDIPVIRSMADHPFATEFPEEGTDPVRRPAARLPDFIDRDRPVPP